MANAKTQFLKAINDKTLICARVGIDREDFGQNIKWFILKNNFSKQEFDDFCDKLNFNYDDGYGSQELFGIILFSDSYSDRGEYDGSEWWENHRMPTIKEVLNPSSDK